MVSIPKVTRKGKHFTVGNINQFDDIESSTLSNSVFSTLFSSKVLKKEACLNGTEVSINKLEPGQEHLFSNNKSLNNELYIFLKGKGHLQINDESIGVSEGTVLRVDPKGINSWVNNSDQELYFICIQNKPETLIEYSFFDGIPV